MNSLLPFLQEMLVHGARRKLSSFCTLLIEKRLHQEMEQYLCGKASQVFTPFFAEILVLTRLCSVVEDWFHGQPFPSFVENQVRPFPIVKGFSKEPRNVCSFSNFPHKNAIIPNVELSVKCIFTFHAFFKEKIATQIFFNLVLMIFF